MSSVDDRIQSMIDRNKVLLFMKGTRSIPMCGFSAAVIQLLDRASVPYETVDVLEDPEIREGVKAFSSWPTIPQLYVGGKFVGGCDIVREMDARGELAPLLRAATSEG
jgi:monothiol glutaredoxin